MEQSAITRRELSSQLDRAAEASAVRRTKQEQAIYYEKATRAVIENYVRVRQLSPIVASNPDPDPAKRSEKLTYDLINWCADVEMATEQALAGRSDLQSAWFSLGLEQPITPALEREVLQKCGRLYAARRLEPWKYWRRGNR